MQEVESDEKADTESPIFDSSYCFGGSEAVVKIVNFTPAEFRKPYGIHYSIIVAN